MGRRRERSTQHASRRRALGLIAAGTVAAAVQPERALAQAGLGLGPGLKPQRGKDNEVDLVLALAVDASGSVSASRFELQKQGYASAFRDRRVLKAIRSGPAAAIAICMYQWTGYGMQASTVDWARVGDEGSINRFADAIAATNRFLHGGGTSLSGAIDHGVRIMRASPFEAARHVIDVSGDGSNNNGRPSHMARDEAVAAGININGLPILAVEPNLEGYYRDNVIGGPGAFAIPAATFEDFGAAILRKLILEISGVSPPSALRRG